MYERLANKHLLEFIYQDLKPAKFLIENYSQKKTQSPSLKLFQTDQPIIVLFFFMMIIFRVAEIYTKLRVKNSK
jgi:hypothetical protein